MHRHRFFDNDRDYSRRTTPVEEARARGFLTNFSIDLLPVYREAVRLYGDKTLEVKETNHAGEHGYGDNFQGSLWFYGYGDLGRFWAIYEAIKADKVAAQKLAHAEALLREAEAQRDRAREAVQEIADLAIAGYTRLRDSVGRIAK